MKLWAAFREPLKCWAHCSCCTAPLWPFWASWSIPSVHVRGCVRSHPLPGVRIWGEPGSKPSQHVVSFVFPAHFLLHPHPCTAGVYSEMQTNGFLFPVLWLSGESLHLVTSFWQTPERGHTSAGVTFHPPRALCLSLVLKHSSSLQGWLFQSPLAWCSPPGRGFCSAQHKQRHQQKQSWAFFIPMQVLDGVTWSL